MALQDLNDQLHGRDFHDRERVASTYEPRTLSAEEKSAELTPPLAWQKPVIEEKGSIASYFAFYTRLDRKQRIAAITGSLAILLLIFGLVIKLSGMLFNEENIALSLSAPTEVPSGERLSFSVHYTNDNWEAIDEAVLVLSYPETFALDTQENLTTSRTRAEIPIGKIAAKESGKWDFSGTFSGFQGGLAALQATLQYAPPGLSARFHKTSQISINITPSLFTLEVSAPREVTSGQSVEYIVDYRNTSDQSYPDTRLQMEYPEGFRFSSGEPRSSEGETVWYLGTLAPGSSGRIIVRGILSGANNESRRIRALIGHLEGNGNFVTYNLRERDTRITASPLSIFQSVNGLVNTSVNPGDTLQYSIKYRNDGTVGLRDAIVTVELGSPYLNYQELSFTTPGSYDGERKMLVWKASDVPALGQIEPGSEGEIQFRIPVLQNYSVNPGERGLSIQSVAKIDSVDLPTPVGANKIIGSNTLLVKINSLVTPTLQVFYHDQTFPNTGPLPPVVGQETTYTARLRVKNSSSDITRARAIITLPSGVDYKEKFAPERETLVFNERGNTLTWELGTLSAGMERELVFQIGITPSQNQVARPVILINGIDITGLDTYTNGEVQVRVEKRENYIPEDRAAENQSGEVRQAE